MLRRRLSLYAATAALLVPWAGPAAAGPNAGPTGEADGEGTVAAADEDAGVERRYHYEVSTAGQVHTDVGAFAADVRDILGDARGWTLGGSVAFAPVASGGDLEVILASPQAVADAAPVCSRDYSCRVGDRVYINDRNWREATPAWRDAGGELWRYRSYLINHEVGHYLGFGHRHCPASGAPAPVMQQQSIDLEGCAPNGWPTDPEREELGDTLGVTVHDWVYPDVLVDHPHRAGIHAAADQGIALGHADGFFRPGEAVQRDQMASFLQRATGVEASSPPSFDDVDPEGPHGDAIAAVEEAGIAQGYEDGTYRPFRHVSRDQMASFLAAAYDLEAEDDPPYRDVHPDDVHADAIAAVTEAGIAQGYDDGTYRPHDPVARGQMATFLTRATGDAE